MLDLSMQVLSMPGVSGLHVMPISKASREMALDCLKRGLLQPMEHQQQQSSEV